MRSDDLRTLVRDAIERWINPGMLALTRRVEATERAGLAALRYTAG
jgi:hypothetical protein